MSKVSGNNHSQSQMNHHSNQSNPNNSAHHSSSNNHSNQFDVLPTPEGGGFCFTGRSNKFLVGNHGLTLPPQGTTTCP